MDFPAERLGQADEHVRLRRHDATPRFADLPRLYRSAGRVHRGVCIILGLATRYASLVLLLFVIIASFSSHRYWAVEAAQVANQSSHFWKNVTIKGGLVLLFITGAGRFALDYMLAKRR